MTDPLLAVLSTTREHLVQAAQTLVDAGWKGAPSAQQIDLLSVQAVLRNHPAAARSALIAALQAISPVADAKHSDRHYAAQIVDASRRTMNQTRGENDSATAIRECASETQLGRLQNKDSQ
jgi:hypothetical protein